MSTWLDSFLDELASPGWAAGVLETFTGAVIAFGGAAALFRGQIRNDRRLAAEQADRNRGLFLEELEAVRESQAAARRASAARALGVSLIEAADEWDRIDNAGAAARLSVRGWDGERAAPGADLIYDGVKVAQRDIDVHAQPLDIWRARLSWWRAVRQHMEDPRLLALTPGRRESVLFSLVDKYFSPQRKQLYVLGRKLMRWDGYGDLPELDEEVTVPSRDEAGQAVEVTLKDRLSS